MFISQEVPLSFGAQSFYLRFHYVDMIDCISGQVMQSPPSLEKVRPTSLHSKPNSIITKFVSLEGPTSIQNQVLSTNSGVVPRGPL